jgi:recombinational DNA repair ATPase RecF
LDDVLSEMDVSRRRRVLEKITGYEQVMITTTDQELIQQLLGRKAAYFRVEGGQVIAQGQKSESAPSADEMVEEGRATS